VSRLPLLEGVRRPTDIIGKFIGTGVQTTMGLSLESYNVNLVKWDWLGSSGCHREQGTQDG
jgi:hypothetical protein